MSLPVQRGKRYRLTVDAFVYSIHPNGRLELCTKHPVVTLANETDNETVYGAVGSQGYLPPQMIVEDPVEIAEFVNGEMYAYDRDGPPIYLIYDDSEPQAPWVRVNTQRRLKDADVVRQYLIRLVPERDVPEL